MKFKVGDKVRLTREAISYKLREQHTIKYSIILWEKITDISEWDDMILVDYIWYKTEYLELVPEEPEFKLWEEIEVKYEGEDKWWKAIFLFYLPETFGYRYLCVKGYSSTSFKIWGCFETAQRECARKLKQALTRKEIAEKFGIAEDFILEE